MRALCLIPARGGSKGIPKKNLAEIEPGVTLLERTIRQGLRCYPSDDVIVSTENDEIAELARREGARVLPRPGELATDESTTASVVDHVLGQLDPDASRFDVIGILQVTSPLRNDADIRKSQQLIGTGKYDSVLSAFRLTDNHPAKMYFADGDSAISVVPGMETARRQDLPNVFRRNGAIFMVTRTFHAATGLLWGGRVGLVKMPKERSIDIDKPEQLEAARNLLREYR